MGRRAHHGRLLPPRLLASALERTRVFDGAADRRHHCPARRRRPPALRITRGAPCPPLRCMRHHRVAAQARVHRRSALQARTRRVHGRCRRHHDHQPDRQGERIGRRGRLLHHRSEVLLVERAGIRPVVALGRHGGGGGRAPHRPDAEIPSRADAAHRRCARSGRRIRTQLARAGDPDGGRNRLEATRDRAGRRHHCRCRCPCPPGHGRVHRGVHRQPPHGSHVRGPSPPAHRQQSRAPCPRCLQSGSGCRERVSGELECEPGGDRRGERSSDTGRLAGGGCWCAHGAHRPAGCPCELSGCSARRPRHLCRHPTCRRVGVSTALVVSAPGICAGCKRCGVRPRLRHPLRSHRGDRPVDYRTPHEGRAAACCSARTGTRRGGLARRR